MAEIFRAHSTQSIPSMQAASCAFGVFDGVHLGHRFLLEQAIATAHESGGRSIALTFDIDPDELFCAEVLKKLQTNTDRINALAASGVDEVVVLPFTESFARLSPQEFLDLVFGSLPPAHVHVGRDIRFGHKGSGTVEDLYRFAQDNKICIHAHDLVCDEGKPITSTRIRTLLGEGRITEANALLGKRYSITGRVQSGKGLGESLGFATANLVIDSMYQVLAEGVYAAYAHTADGCWRAAVSVGKSSLFAHAPAVSMEAHLLDYDGDLYGSEIRLEFCEYLRPMIDFSTKEELIDTVLSNIAWVRDNIDIPQG